MYKRSYIDEDPYVNIGDHPIDVMYAELVKTHGGMDVFIKTSSLQSVFERKPMQCTIWNVLVRQVFLPPAKFM